MQAPEVSSSWCCFLVQHPLRSIIALSFKTTKNPIAIFKIKHLESLSSLRGNVRELEERQAQVEAQMVERQSQYEAQLQAQLAENRAQLQAQLKAQMEEFMKNYGNGPNNPP